MFSHYKAPEYIFLRKVKKPIIITGRSRHIARQINSSLPRMKSDERIFNPCWAKVSVNLSSRNIIFVIFTRMTSRASVEENSV
jgi:hypothetical protein